ncbi:hypothetical protein AMTRI_Chr04g246650 [Amborella trichopoda]|uniref:Uncharacterized protein n=1 Tax=Amborella trichopoda TaxID=13333 RepID=W1NI65_AMBTC|nr:hypothetical protein AMTR_s00008p00267740 [Amborella trichopoda]
MHFLLVCNTVSIEHPVDAEITKEDMNGSRESFYHHLADLLANKLGAQERYPDPFLGNINRITNPKTAQSIKRPAIPTSIEKSKSTRKTKSTSPLTGTSEYEPLIKGKKKNQSPSAAKVPSTEFDAHAAKSKNSDIGLKGRSKRKENSPSPPTSKGLPKRSKGLQSSDITHEAPEFGVPHLSSSLIPSTRVPRGGPTKGPTSCPGLHRKTKAKKMKKVGEIYTIELDTPSPSSPTPSSPALRTEAYGEVSFIFYDPHHSLIKMKALLML